MNSDEFRSMALSFPDASESTHMNHPDFRLGGKVFASLGFPDDTCAMVRLTAAQQQSLMDVDAESFQPCSGAWGTRGYTNILLASVKKSAVRLALQMAAENVATPAGRSRCSSRTPKAKRSRPRPGGRQG
jgi:hypothetical protein